VLTSFEHRHEASNYKKDIEDLDRLSDYQRLIVSYSVKLDISLLPHTLEYITACEKVSESTAGYHLCRCNIILCQNIP
jgi:hypothetical protein